VPSVSKVSFAGEQTNKSRGDILVIGGEGREGGERGGPEESLGGKGGKQEEAVCADEDALGLSMVMLLSVCLGAKEGGRGGREIGREREGGRGREREGRRGGRKGEEAGREGRHCLAHTDSSP